MQNNTPFVMIELSLLECNLSTYERSVLVALKSFAGRNGRAWPSEATIAKRAACSERHVRNCLRSLEEKGLIKIIRRQGTSNLYLLPAYYDLKGEELVPVWQEDSQAALPREEPQHHIPEGHTSPQEENSSSSKPPWHPVQAGVEPRSEKKYKNKKYISKKSLSLKSSTENVKEPRQELTPEKREIFEEWEKTFNQKLPASLKRQPSAVISCDYMLALYREGFLRHVRVPVAYLRRIMEAPPAPNDFESLRAYKERLRREEEERRRAREEERRRREQEEAANEAWQNLPPEEKEKWLELARADSRTNLGFSVALIGKLLFLADYRAKNAPKAESQKEAKKEAPQENYLREGPPLPPRRGPSQPTHIAECLSFLQKPSNSPQEGYIISCSQESRQVSFSLKRNKER